MMTKITELGRLAFLDDGGLVCSVTSEQPPPLDVSIRAASLYWASANEGEPTIGDLVVHSDHGVAGYRGCKRINQGDGYKDFLVLEYAHGAELYVPVNRSYLVQKLVTDYPLTNLHAKSNRWPQSYCIEALPNAYEWPAIGAFPKIELPQEPEWRRTCAIYLETSLAHEAYLEAHREAMDQWLRACVAYRSVLHANPSYRQAAQGYFERQNHEPQPFLEWWVYRGIVLRVGLREAAGARHSDEHLLVIKQYALRRERKVERMRREVETLERCGNLEGVSREPIAENVRLFVWQRDKGQCVRCGSRERLEFDHIIPVAAGGSSTERNIQLLCESCNRSKGATV